MHWSPATVRSWWQERRALEAWLEGRATALTTGIKESHASRVGNSNQLFVELSNLRLWRAYVHDGLEDYLRGYIFLLEVAYIIRASLFPRMSIIARWIAASEARHVS